MGEGETLFAAAAQPKAFVPLHLGADHLLTDRVTAGRAVETLVAWLRSTLDGAGPSAGGDQRPDQ